jgi:hypothetical protein
MASSGTYTYTQNRDQIIRRAGRLTGAFRAGETPGSQVVSDFADALNAMVKRWVASGIHLWTTQEATLFLQPNQRQYLLSSTGDNATQSYSTTRTTAAASAGATSLTVASIAGIVSGQFVGAVLAGGSIQWTLVNGAPSGSSVPLTAALTDIVPSGASVYTYTNKIVRPLRVVSARKYNFASGLESPMLPMMARLDYQALPNKANTGSPNQAFYDPQLGAGLLNVWPTPVGVGDAINFTWYRPIQDFNVAGDTPDFPQEWTDTLVFNLASLMGPEFDTPAERMQMIDARAVKFLDEVSGWDREPESMFLGVNMDQQR